MSDHDNQLVPGDLLEDIHDLNRGLAVQGAGGLVGQQDIRVVDQGPGDSHPLHLAAGELVGPLFHLVLQSHLLQGLFRPSAALGLADAGKGQGQLHVAQHALVGDQVIALEHKADGVVAVGVPIPVGILLGGAAVDDEVAAGVLVQAADNVQQGGLAASGMAQHRHKLALPEAQAHPPQGGDVLASGLIYFYNVFYLQHMVSSCFAAPRRSRANFLSRRSRQSSGFWPQAAAATACPVADSSSSARA